ncbi:hypothetical protein CPB84DRAFT_1771012 [Gymnopilus junonius]|uniref:DUF4246 domain-containing protein n=1 Tax=Gymnopilus junonius TaxID=109634 RepID=A0A9P5NPW7_GYMJU|nr:hypothetical protein CPB84DRAFT_1777542 [Gymnopilus junonius]KAF8905715.1 hypothetical protein CPB84DRAFT_1771012 [Gymnopilus junonius]
MMAIMDTIDSNRRDSFHDRILVETLNQLMDSNPMKELLKILALFLVDPHIKILSTAHVPPKQKEWWQEEICRMDIWRKQRYCTWTRS